MYVDMLVTFWTPWNHHIVYGRPFSPSPWSNILTDISILVTGSCNLSQTLLGGIWRIFGRVFSDWMSENCVVSRTTPSGLTLWFWLLYSFCNRDTSRSDPPSYTYHIPEVLDGVGRPGKSHWAPLVPWPPTCPLTHLPFAPGTSQMLFLSCTVYIHATSTFLDPCNRFPLLTSHLPSSSPSSAFFCFWVIRDSAHSILHVPPYIYIIEHSYCTPFDRLFS